MTYKTGPRFSEVTYVNVRNETEFLLIAIAQSSQASSSLSHVKYIGVAEYCEDGYVIYLPHDHPLRWNDDPKVLSATISSHAIYTHAMQRPNLADDTVLRYRAFSIYGSHEGISPFAEDVKYRQFTKIKRNIFAAETAQGHGISADKRIELVFSNANRQLTMRETPLDNDAREKVTETQYRQHGPKRQYG